MANVDPLASLTPEEMAELLRKKQAEKQVMASRSGFNPSQYAPTYGAAPPPGLPADFYSRLPASDVGHLDKSKGYGTPRYEVHPEAWKGKLNIPAIVRTGLASKGAAHHQGMVMDQLMNPDRNIPEVGTPMVGYRAQELSRLAGENILRLQADPTSKESQQIAAQAYEQQADALARRGMTPGQREDAVRSKLDADVNLYINKVAPNLLRTQQAESAVTLPIMKKVLERDQTFPEFINTMSQDPRALVNLVFSSLAKTPEAIVLGTLGAGLGATVGNPIIGGALGVGAGSATSEVMIGFNEALRTVAEAEGFEIDASTEEGLRALLDRPDILAKAISMNQTRAGVVGGGMALTTYLTGRIAAAMFQAGMRTPAVVAAVASQGAGEAGTEAAAQLLSGEVLAEGGFDMGSIFSEAAASIGTSVIPIGSAIYQGTRDQRQQRFNSLRDQINSSGTVVGDAAVEYNKIFNHIMKKYPNIVIDDDTRTTVNSRGEEVLSQGYYSDKDGKIHMSLKAIIGNSDTPQEALERATQVATRHERVHQVLDQYRARGDIENDPVEEFLKTNNIAINEWIKSNPAYEDLLSLWKIGDESGEFTPEQLVVAEEYMIAMSEANTGFLDKLRVWALGVARDRGIEIDSSEEAQVIIENVLREFRGNPWAPFDSAEAKESAIDEGRRSGIPSTESAAPQFSGFGAGPGVAPEMEGVLRAAEADAAPTGTYVTPQASEAFDDFNPEQALEEDRAQEQRVRKWEESQRIPQKWQELDTENLQVLAEANRAKDNPIWQAQFKELERRKAVDEETADQEMFIQAVEEIISIYDANAPITEDLESGALNERIKAIAKRTGYSEAELSGAVQNYITDLEEAARIEVETEVDMYANIARKDMTPEQVTTRNVNNYVAKRAAPVLEKDPEKFALLKRLQKLFGAPAVKAREGQAGTTEQFIRLSQEIANGNLSEVEKFVLEGEELLAASVAEKRAAKPTAWVKRKAAEQGISVDDVKVAPRRRNVPLYEKFISPKLAMDMAQQQFDDGKITAKQLDTIKGKIVEAQTTIRTTGKLKAVITDALRAEGIEITEQELKYWSEQAEIIGRKQVPAEIKKQEARPKQEVRDELDKIYKDMEKAGVEVTRIPSFDQHVFKPDATVGPRVKSVGWIDDLGDTSYTADEGVEIEGEMYEGFQVDDNMYANVVAKPKALPKGFEAGPQASNVIAFSNAGHKYIVNDIDENGKATVTLLREGRRPAAGITIDDLSTLRFTTTKAGAERDMAFRNLHRALNGNQAINKLSKEDAEKLTLAWYEQDGTQIPDRWKRNLLPIMFGPKINNELAAFNSTMNKLLGPKVMATDHTVELDQFFTPGVVKALIEGRASAEVTARAAEILSETNLTFMPQFLNNLKKSLRSGTGKLSLEERTRRENALNDWYDSLNTYLRTSTEDGPAVGMADAHIKALKQWVDNHSDVFPEGSASYNQIQNLKKLLASGVDLGDVDAINALYAEGTPLRAAYLDNLKNKGILSTQDEVFVKQFSNEVKKDLDGFKELQAKAVKKHGVVDTRKVDAKFTNYTAYNWLQFVFGRPVMAVDAFNRESFMGGKMTGDVPIASVIANIIYRNPAASGRPEGMETGTDMVQEMSMRTGEFNSRLSKIFSGLTNNEGVITPETNALIVDHLVGKDVTFPNDASAKAAGELKTFLEDMYQYAKDRTNHLETPIDLRGAGDTVLPRVWNTEYISTKEGKEQFLKAVSDKFTDPEGRSIFEEIDITPEDLYTMVVNSGGFVQGDWRQIAQDQNTSKKEIEKAELIQEYLDSLNTEELVGAGLVIDDIQAVLPRFVQKAIRRTEYSAVFGSKDEILRSLIQIGVDQIKVHNDKVLGTGKDAGGEIIDEKKFVKAVWDMSNILRNKYGYESADLPTRRWLQRASNVETIAKLPLVTLASLPEFFTPMLKGDVRPDKFLVDFGMATAFAGYKGMNGVSKLLFNKHLPAMLKHSSEIGGLGIISDIQLLRELGIADIQAMGDIASTRYVNPSFAPGGIKSGAKGTLGAKVPKSVRAVFNMQTYMQATMLTTITEMQQFMALRNFRRHMGSRIQAVNDSKGKKLKGKRATNRLKQFKQDMLDYGITEDIDLNTAEGQAAFTAGALRFVDQVITRPNDATTAKIFRNPLTAPLVLFKRFITTYGNTLLTSVGRNMADKVDNVERAKQVGKLTVAGASMYGAVMFAEMMRSAIKGEVDEEDTKIVPEDFKTFMRRVDRMGVLGAPGSMAANLTFPSKAWYGDTGTNRLVRELTGPLGSDMAGTLDFLMSKKGEKDLRKLLGQIAPTSRQILPKQKKTKKKRKKKGPAGGLY